MVTNDYPGYQKGVYVWFPKNLPLAFQNLIALDRGRLELRSFAFNYNSPVSAAAAPAPGQPARRKHMQKISPFLWFDGKAEEAANFYTSIFKNSKILHVSRYGDAGPGPKGSVMLVAFEIEGQKFSALNAGPQYTFSPAISFFVDCETQTEVDELWQKLTVGGKEIQCGWLTDKFGVSWQIVPRALMELMQDKDPVKSQRVFKAMMGMIKIDVEALKRAYRGE
jgi:predicted 3-demethylubiquinone-9 3-methyltransferase (glyoxalase superfamily)